MEGELVSDEKLQYPLELPPMVLAATSLSERMGFGADGGVSSCLPGIGAFLAVLASSRPGGRIAEIGTGYGVGAAWLLSGMDSAASLVTVEIDETRAGAARGVLGSDDRVTVIADRWQDCLPGLSPFDLVFVDGGYVEHLADDPRITDMVVDLVSVGGQLLLDDLTAEAEWPDEWRNRPDPKRELAFQHPLLAGAEFYVPGPTGAVGGARTGGLLMTRVA
jgi:predicted O-methyltransferase YrrM